MISYPKSHHFKRSILLLASRQKHRSQNSRKAILPENNWGVVKALSDGKKYNLV